MEYLPIIFFVVVLIFLLLGYPVSFTLGGVSVVFGLLTFGLSFFNLLPLRIWGIMDNYVLIAVPLFIYMGVMLDKSGIAEELLETMALLFGKLKGGLAISVLIVGACSVLRWRNSSNNGCDQSARDVKKRISPACCKRCNNGFGYTGTNNSSKYNFSITWKCVKRTCG